MVSARFWPLASAIVLIALATLMPTSSSQGASSFCLLCGDRGLADFLSNVILFSTFGVASALSGYALRATIVAGAMLSGAIEVLQIDLILGRDANVGDVVANTLGTAVGWLVAWLRPCRSARALGLRASAILTAVTCSGLLVGLLLFTPVLPPPPYYLFWTPDYENHALYQGRVLSTRLGPLTWRQDYLPMEPDTIVRRLLQTNPLEIRFLAGPPPPRASAPIVAVQTRDLEILLLSARGGDFVYRYWSVGDELRMDHGELRIPGVLEGLPVGDTVDLAFVSDKRGYCIEVNGRSRCGRGFAVGDTWTALANPGFSAAATTAVGLAWCWLVFLPCGYAANSRSRVLAITIGATLSLAAAPIALGFAMTPWYQLAAIVLGIISGYSLAGAYRRLQAQDSSG